MILVQKYKLNTVTVLQEWDFIMQNISFLLGLIAYSILILYFMLMLTCLLCKAQMQSTFLFMLFYFTLQMVNDLDKKSVTDLTVLAF